MFEFEGLFPWSEFSVCEIMVLLEVGEGVIIDVDEVGWAFGKNDGGGREGGF